SFRHLRRLPPLPLFPYTTLFRSDAAIARAVVANLPWMDSFFEPTAAAQDVVFLFLLDAAMQRRIDDLNEDSTAATIMDAACARPDRKSTRLNSSHVKISYAVFCL